MIGLSLAVVAARLVARPDSFTVAGRSMLPGLAPGDAVSTGGWRDHWRIPARFERWIVDLPDGTSVVKRIVAVGGERLEIRHGDLFIDGERLLGSPSLLAETAVGVDGGDWSTVEEEDVDWRIYRHRVIDFRRRPDDPARCVPGPIFDDMPGDPHEQRRLERVPDVGIAVVVEHQGKAASTILLRVGTQAARCFISPAGKKSCLVAGRLDGRFVAAVWPYPEGQPWRRSVLPPGIPDEWSIVADVIPSSTSAVAPLIGVGVMHDRVDPSKITDAEATFESGLSLHRATIWRAMHVQHSPHGKDQWNIPTGSFFLLGDHSSVSRDSRHFGSLDLSSFRGRLTRHASHRIGDLAPPAW